MDAAGTTPSTLPMYPSDGGAPSPVVPDSGIVVPTATADASPLPSVVPDGGACPVSGDLVLAFDGLPMAIGLDEQRVYFLHDDESSIIGNPNRAVVSLRSVPKCGGAVTIIGRGPYFGPGADRVVSRSLAVDVDAIYFSTSNGSAGSLLRAPKGGGPTETLFEDNNVYPHDVAVDATSIYWAEPLSGSVVRMAKADRSRTVLVSGLTYPEHIALGGDSVYVADQKGLFKIPINGSAPPSLLFGPLCAAPVTACAMSLHLQGDAVYVGVGGITKIPKAGGAADKLAARPDLWAFGVSSTSIYMVSGLIVELSVMPLTGGPMLLRESNDKAPGVLALDDSAVYWSAGGRLTRTPL